MTFAERLRVPRGLDDGVELGGVKAHVSGDILEIYRPLADGGDGTCLFRTSAHNMSVEVRHEDEDWSVRADGQAFRVAVEDEAYAWAELIMNFHNDSALEAEVKLEDGSRYCAVCVCRGSELARVRLHEVSECAFWVRKSGRVYVVGGSLTPPMCFREANEALRVCRNVAELADANKGRMRRVTAVERCLERVSRWLRTPRAEAW